MDLVLSPFLIGFAEEVFFGSEGTDEGSCHLRKGLLSFALSVAWGFQLILVIFGRFVYIRKRVVGRGLRRALEELKVGVYADRKSKSIRFSLCDSLEIA